MKEYIRNIGNNLRQSTSIRQKTVDNSNIEMQSVADVDGDAHDDTKQCKVLYDIIDIFNSKGGVSDSLDEIILHPVIATFIWKKWQKTQYFYYFISFLFALFLFSYSYIIYITFGNNAQNVTETNTTFDLSKKSIQNKCYQYGKKIK